MKPRPTSPRRRHLNNRSLPSRVLPDERPPLVATASLSEAQIGALRAAFLRAHEEPSLPLRTLLIERFVVPDLSVYDETRRRAERVERAEEWP